MQDECNFKTPTFQPLSSRYKKLEEKRRAQEEEDRVKQLKIKLKKAKQAEAEGTASAKDLKIIQERTNEKEEPEKVRYLLT